MGFLDALASLDVVAFRLGAIRILRGRLLGNCRPPGRCRPGQIRYFTQLGRLPIPLQDPESLYKLWTYLVSVCIPPDGIDACCVHRDHRLIRLMLSYEAEAPARYH